MKQFKVICDMLSPRLQKANWFSLGFYGSHQRGRGMGGGGSVDTLRMYQKVSLVISRFVDANPNSFVDPTIHSFN